MRCSLGLHDCCCVTDMSLNCWHTLLGLTVCSSKRWCDREGVVCSSRDSHHEDVGVVGNATCVGHLDDKRLVPAPTNWMKT